MLLPSQSRFSEILFRRLDVAVVAVISSSGFSTGSIIISVPSDVTKVHWTSMRSLIVVKIWSKFLKNQTLVRPQDILLCIGKGNQSKKDKMANTMQLAFFLSFLSSRDDLGSDE
jgi:hypothetical protein